MQKEFKAVLTKTFRVTVNLHKLIVNVDAKNAGKVNTNVKNVNKKNQEHKYACKR